MAVVCRTGLLYFCLAFLPTGAQEQARQDRGEETGSAALPSPQQYEHLQKQLGALRGLSQWYWHFLACQLWQGGCEREQEGRAQREEEEEGSRGILQQQEWNLPILTELVSTWYCSFGRCCTTGDCRVTDNITVTLVATSSLQWPWQAGQARGEITMDYLEQYLRIDLLDAPEARNCLLQENLIDFLVPFLPLEYHHVKLCAQDAFLAQGLKFTEEVLVEVARTMVFVPKENKLFSAQGCKSISQHINYFLL